MPRGRWTVVDFSSSALRVLAVRSGRVVGQAAAALPAAAYERGVIRDPAAAGAVVRELWSRAGGRGRRAVFLLGDEHALQRLLDLPAVPRRALAPTVESEARRELAYEPEAMRLHWREVARDGRVKVLAAAVLREAVDACRATLRFAGLKAVRGELYSTALVRAVGAENAFVVHLGEGGLLTFIAVENHLPSLSYCSWLEPGGQAALSIEQAMASSVAAQRRFGRLTMETPVYLAGVAADPAVAAELAARGRRVRELEAVPRLPAAEYLALWGALQRRDGYALVDLVPPEARHRVPVQLRPALLLGVLLAAQLGGYTYAYLHFLAPPETAARSQLVRAEGELGDLRQIRSEVDAYRRARMATATLRAQVAALRGTGADWAALAPAVQQAAAGRVTLTALSAGSGTLTVTGTGGSLGAVDSFVRAMPYPAQLSSLKRTGRGLDFTVTAVLKGVK
ncbi:MAG: hypothetical protein M0031_03255 [Thermaerobacter sp.]|jgi:hypothetical protein|nr:hypothetical protein [Thermaerobacter sp.]